MIYYLINVFVYIILLVDTSNVNDAEPRLSFSV